MEEVGRWVHGVVLKKERAERREAAQEKHLLGVTCVPAQVPRYLPTHLLGTPWVGTYLSRCYQVPCR